MLSTSATIFTAKTEEIAFSTYPLSNNFTKFPSKLCWSMILHRLQYFPLKRKEKKIYIYISEGLQQISGLYTDNNSAILPPDLCCDTGVRFLARKPPTLSEGLGGWETNSSLDGASDTSIKATCNVENALLPWWHLELNLRGDLGTARSQRSNVYKTYSPA